MSGKALAAAGGELSLTGKNVSFVVVAAVIALVALGFAAALVRAVLATGKGTTTMQEIAGAVQEGATAYLFRQFKTLGVFVVIAVLLLFVLPVNDAEHSELAVKLGRSGFFIVGAVFSAFIGGAGMSLATRANLRVAAAAREATGGRESAMRIAFRTGGVVGFLTVGLGLFGACLVVLSYRGDAPIVLEGFGFGAALLAMFMRVGGGIFTKAADVGADLVGKVEQNIPEDDPRNAATIADNVGDNVGDCAGMAADLFETYAVTAVAVMLLGILTFSPIQATDVVLFPLVLGGVSILASIAGTFAVRSDNVERALYQGLILAGVIAAVLFLPVTQWMMDGLRYPGRGGAIGAPSAWDIYLCSLIGLGVTACLFVITDYYTSTRFSPVKKTSAASETGHATNIIQGFASGLQATALPALVIVLGILGAHSLA
jgi:K(+)-stimulated pyrophosphate-energized sodium pump